MAKLRKPIAVEAENGEAGQSEITIEPSDIVGGVQLADVAGITEAAAAPPAENTAKNAETETEVSGGKDTPPEPDKAAEEEKQPEAADIHDMPKLPSKQKRSKAAKERRTKTPREPVTKNDRGGMRAVIIAICAILVIAGFSLWVIYDNNQLEKNFYQVKSSKVADNIRIVSIADLHNKEFGDDNERLVYEISKLSPDIIALVGDMIMEQQPDNYESTLSLCKQLEEIAPVYFSLGNHEIDAMLFGGSNIYKDAKKQGIKILNNEVEQIEIKGTPIDVIGLTQNPVEFEEYGREFFENALAADDNFKLLLTHYPEMYLGVLDDYEVDLALAGHAHGGQVRLPWIGGMYAADQGFFPELCDGYWEIENNKLVITRGLGKSGWCPRINNTPEITVVDLSWY